MSSRAFTGYSKTPTGKAAKGAVVVLSSHGRLQLRFRVNGKRYYLSTGYPDTRDHRKLAEARARLIQSDIDLDRFDPTLDRYRPQSTPLAAVEVTPITPKTQLSELWELYTEFRRSQIAQTTLRIQYAAVASHVRRLPTQSLDDALEIRDFFLKKLTLDTTRRTITQISACCDWAVESALIAVNPFRGMAEKIKVIKSSSKELDEIDPFTKDERDAIVAAFEFHPVYSYYAPFVKFLFWTGARTGEAIALKWKHISRDFTTITFCESVSSQLKIRKDTKTHKARKFPCNSQLQTLLKSIKPGTADLESLVFPSKRGGEINSRHFIQNAWKGGQGRKGQISHDGIVTQLVKENKVKRYRTQYNTRHTFITCCLEERVSIPQIAKWVGNSPETILKHYAGIINKVLVPEF